MADTNTSNNNAGGRLDEEEAIGLTSEEMLTSKRPLVLSARSKLLFISLFSFIAFFALLAFSNLATVGNGGEGKENAEVKLDEKLSPQSTDKTTTPKEAKTTGTLAPDSFLNQMQEEEERAEVIPTKTKSDLGSFTSQVLDSIKCIPQICKQRERFVQHKNFTLLASYPGSVEEGTKVWTGSVYEDYALYHDGFKGELMDPFRTVESRVSAIKTHYPYYGNPRLNPKTRAVIIVMRSPFDAILAEFTRRYGVGAAHRNQVSNSTLQKHFPLVYNRGIFKWTTYSEFWIGPTRRSAAFVNRERGVTSYEFEHVIVNHKVPVLVLFYEDFVRNLVVTTERLFEFLKLQLRDAMPTTAVEAMVCTITEGRKSQNKEKRVHKEDRYNFYLDVKNQAMLQKACKVWAPHWFEEVWGPCLNPIPQVDRLPVSKKEWDRLETVTEYCEKKDDSPFAVKEDEEEEEHIKGDDYAQAAAGGSSDAVEEEEDYENEDYDGDEDDDKA